MLKKLIGPMLALAALFSLPLAAVGGQQPARIVAVGDLHGDYEAWIAIARAAGLIDARGRWAGGNTTLVQMGDVVDRGPDSLKIIEHLQRLEKEAKRKGGRLIVLVGNHEAMMMTGDRRYVHPGEYAAMVDKDSAARREKVFTLNQAAVEASYRARDPAISAEAIKQDWLRQVPLGMVEHQLAWKPDGPLGKWAIGNPAVVKLGDTLFVHGGISAAFANHSIDQINQQVAEALKAGDERPEAIVNHPQGPLWYRGLISRGSGDEATLVPLAPGTAAPPTIADEIALVLNNYQVRRIVVAHTPSLKGIVSHEGGKLWQIDSAISRAYGGTPSYLEIRSGQVRAVSVPRPAAPAWGR